MGGNISKPSLKKRALYRQPSQKKVFLSLRQKVNMIYLYLEKIQGDISDLDYEKIKIDIFRIKSIMEEISSELKEKYKAVYEDTSQDINGALRALEEKTGLSSKRTTSKPTVAGNVSCQGSVSNIKIIFREIECQEPSTSNLRGAKSENNLVHTTISKYTPLSPFVDYKLYLSKSQNIMQGQLDKEEDNNSSTNLDKIKTNLKNKESNSVFLKNRYSSAQSAENRLKVIKKDRKLVEIEHEKKNKKRVSFSGIIQKKYQEEEFTLTPLENIEEVRLEVHQLEKEMNNYQYIDAKEYQFLKKNFIRSLIELENIDVGEDSVIRQERKASVQHIQTCLRTLEEKPHKIEDIALVQAPSSAIKNIEEIKARVRDLEKQLNSFVGSNQEMYLFLKQNFLHCVSELDNIESDDTVVKLERKSRLKYLQHCLKLLEGKSAHKMETVEDSVLHQYPTELETTDNKDAAVRLEVISNTRPLHKYLKNVDILESSSSSQSSSCEGTESKTAALQSIEDIKCALHILERKKRERSIFRDKDDCMDFKLNYLKNLIELENIVSKDEYIQEEVKHLIKQIKGHLKLLQDENLPGKLLDELDICGGMCEDQSYENYSEIAPTVKPVIATAL